MARVTEQEIAEARRLRAEGLRFEGIAIVLRRSPATISRHIGRGGRAGHCPRGWAGAAGQAGLELEEYAKHVRAGEAWHPETRTWRPTADVHVACACGCGVELDPRHVISKGRQYLNREHHNRARAARASSRRRRRG